MEKSAHRKPYEDRTLHEIAVVWEEFESGLRLGCEESPALRPILPQLGFASQRMQKMLEFIAECLENPDARLRGAPEIEQATSVFKSFAPRGPRKCRIGVYKTSETIDRVRMKGLVARGEELAEFDLSKLKSLPLYGGVRAFTELYLLIPDMISVTAVVADSAGMEGPTEQTIRLNRANILSDRGACLRLRDCFEALALDLRHDWSWFCDNILPNVEIERSITNKTDELNSPSGLLRRQRPLGAG